MELNSLTGSEEVVGKSLPVKWTLNEKCFRQLLHLKKSSNLTQVFIMQPDNTGGLKIHIISFFLDVSRLQSKKKFIPV